MEPKSSLEAMMRNEQQQQILGYSEDEVAMAHLAKTSHVGSASKAAELHARLAPVVMEAMISAAESPAKVKDLFVTARGLSWVERARPDGLFGRDDASLGHSVSSLIFGSTMPALVSGVAEAEGVSEGSAKELLETISAVVLGVMAGLPDRRLTEETLAATLAENTPLPVKTAPRKAPVIDEVVAVVSATALVDGSSAAETGVAMGSSADEGKKSNAGRLVGAAVAVLVLAGVGFVVFGGGESGVTSEPDIVAFDSEEPTTTVTTEPAPPIETTVTTVEPEIVETDIEPVSVDTGDTVSLSIPMLDITDADRGASGVLGFDFNTVTGEVCYRVESTNIEGPYRSHIHVGGYGEQGGIVVDLGPLESGEVGCVDNLPIDTNAILADRTNHYAELHDISEEWTIRGQLSETINGDIVSLSVPMVNDEGVSPDAEGVLNFDFDTVTGEVCYSVESTNIEGPYRSHIHVGDAGVKGGIVVDLGPLESGDVGCVENLPIDTNAILANKSGHYAELHDVSEEFTIRGQLSETIVVEDGAELEAQVDAEGGGASIVLDGGTVFLEGAVPDQATADEMFESLAGIDAVTPVVNNLTVDPDAPLPSGRVVIADAVFFDVASSEVKDLDEATLNAITALALSRDDWILTVVGHTDSQGSDVENLELSLRRATSLRDLLALQGVPDENLRIRGAGETAPIGDNSTDAGRAENRRIEFEFTPKS